MRTILLIVMILPACLEEAQMNSCEYRDALSRNVELSYFADQRGRRDALEMISQGRVGFVGGYLSNGPITTFFAESERSIADDMYKILDKFGPNKIEKIYLTRELSEIKTGNFLKMDDGIRNGDQVERDCYDNEVRAYGIEFNKTMLANVLNKIESS